MLRVATTAPEDLAGAMAALRRHDARLELRPMFVGARSPPKGGSTLPRSRELRVPPQLARWLHIVVDDPKQAPVVARILTAFGGRVQVIPPPDVPVARHHRERNTGAVPRLAVDTDGTPAPAAVATPDYSPMQQYLFDAPYGIGCNAAHAVRGVRGAGVRIIDVENGWNFSHEDIAAGQFGVVHGDLVDDDHGTAVMGIISGDRNGAGIRGLCPDAQVAGASSLLDGQWYPENAVLAALEYLDPGDVLVLEEHTPGPGSRKLASNPTYGYVPAEFFDPLFEAIRYAVSLDVIVIAAAGNGGVSLDASRYGRAFDPRHRDSGAIIVGAGTSGIRGAPRSRLSFSSFGSRVDVQAWGEHVVTAGGISEPEYSDLQRLTDPARCYTASFSGTSSATAIVAGVVALVVACLRAIGQPVPTPARMRSALRATGTPQSGNRGERIGALPDVRELLRILGPD